MYFCFLFYIAACPDASRACRVGQSFLATALARAPYRPFAAVARCIDIRHRMYRELINAIHRCRLRLMAWLDAGPLNQRAFLQTNRAQSPRTFPELVTYGHLDAAAPATLYANASTVTTMHRRVACPPVLGTSGPCTILCAMYVTDRAEGTRQVGSICGHLDGSAQPVTPFACRRPGR